MYYEEDGKYNAVIAITKNKDNIEKIENVYNKKLNVTDISHIASLARLSFSESESERICEELCELLSLADELSAVDSAGGVGLCGALPLEALREDTASESLSREDILAAAPSVSNGFVAVPRAVDAGDGV